MAVYVDHIRDLSAIERNGFIVELHRECIVSGLEGTDWQDLQAALDDSGVPAYFSSPSGDPNLILIERRASLMIEDPAAIRVGLTYERMGQSIRSMPLESWMVRVEGSLSSVSTIEQQDATTDLDVYHTFAGNDEDYAGQTKGQKAKSNLHSPEITLVAESRKRVNVTQITNYFTAYLNKVNSAPLFGFAAKRWKCTDASAEPLDWQEGAGLDVPIWHVRLSFQLSPLATGWEERETYIDPRTGRAPTDLQPQGIVTIAYPQADFNDIFG